MSKTIEMEKHTDEMVLDGATGEWSRRPRTINDNVCHGGDWWATQGVFGIENALLVEALLYPLLFCMDAEPSIEEADSDAVQDSKSGRVKVSVQSSKKSNGKGSGKPKDP